jgi:uncharacterized protein YndB with AHSA1/START domain
MHDLKHLIDIESPAEAVFPLVSTPEGLSQWWSADVTADPSTAAVEVGFFRHATVYRLHAERVVPYTCAEWRCETGKEWQGTVLHFELLAADPRCTLHFRHSGWREETDYFIGCNTVWGRLLFRLKAAAEGRRPGPLFTAEGMDD